MSIRKWSRRAWCVYAQGCAFLGLAIAFAYGLAQISAGAGAAIVVDAPPQGAFTYPDGPKGRPHIRVPLGSPIVYDSTWHIAQGGCQRRITSTFSEGDDAKGFRIVQVRDGEPYPVGQPGRHRVSKPTPLGLTPGLWRFQVEGTAICPTVTHPPVTYADFNVEVYDPDGPVTEPIGQPEVMTPTVPRGGRLHYRMSYRRDEAVPSEVLNTYTTVGPTPSGTPDVVIDRRPTAGLGPGVHTDIDVFTNLSPDLHVGRWKLRQVVVTERPGGKTRYDPQFSFEFEVTP